MTAIVLYGSSIADTTLTAACKMSTTTGGVETSKTMTFTGTNAYGEIMSQGGTYATVTALPAPTGHGWVYQPGAGTFANAAWTAACTLSAVSARVSATLRFYKYSAGTYTSIGSATTTITGVGKTTYSYVTASLPSTTFGASDLLYVDYWWFDNSLYAGTDNPTVYVSNSATAGVINDMKIVTASFTPAGAFTTYLSNAASTTLTTANKLYSTSGSPSTTSTGNSIGDMAGGNLGWSEFYSQGGATWTPLVDGPASPSGHGFLWDVTTLEGKQINAGNWSGTLTMTGTNAGSYASITIDARAYKRSSSGVYTLIVEMISITETFNGTYPVTVTLDPTSASAISFATGDKLYIDVFGYISYASGPTESVNILDLSTDTSGKTGSALAAIVTPGYQQPTVSKDARVRLRQQSGTVPHDAHARFGLTSRVDAATRFGLITMTQDGAATRFGLQLPPDPPLSIYGLHSSSTTLPTAALTGSATGGASSSFTTLIGTSTGYGELWGLGNAGAWAAGGSLPAPDGQGWIWDTTTLEGQTLLGGTFSISHRLATSTAFTTFAATLFGRVYKYSAVNSTYTQIGSTMSVAANLTTTTTLYTMSASLPAMNFSNGDKLYFDSFLNITTSTGGSALATVRVSNSSDASLGILNQAQLTTAGYTTLVKMVDASSRFKLFSATTGYSYKKSLTIDHTKVSGSANLTNFPVLVNHTDANLKTVGNGGHVTSASGFDIIFTDATGTTKYNHELINYNAATGAICAWVQVPSVSFTVDTVFQVYYGNAAITTSQESIPATWDANYLGVYHLDDNPAGTAPQMKDSTGHQAGTTANMVAGDSVTGQIFKGTNFNGTNKYINVGTTNSVKNSAQVTVSAWLKITALNTAIKHDLYSEATSAGTTRFNFLINTANHIDIDGRSTDAGTQTTWVTHTTTLAAGTWYYCVGIYDSVSDVHHVIVNGVDVSASVVLPTFPNTVPSAFTAIGAHSAGTAEWVNGILEESRISNTARTVGWAITEYNNQLTPTTFYAQGTETSNATTTTRDATARFRLQSPVQSKDAASRLRLLATRSVDSISRLRLQSGTTLRNAAARFRLQAATPRTLDAIARLRLQSGVLTHDLQARYRLLATRSADVASRLRLQSALQSKDSQSRFRQLATKSMDALSRFRLQSAQQLKDTLSRFRLLSSAARDAAARFRVQSVIQRKDALSRFRQQSGTTFHDALARFRLVITPLRDALSRFRLQSPVQSRDTPSRFRQLATRSVDALSRFRQQSIQTLHDAVSRFRLVITPLRDAQARFRLQSAVQNRDASSRFRQLASRSIDALTRFRQQSGQTLHDVRSRFRLVKALDALARFRLVKALDAVARFRQQSVQQLRDVTARFRQQSAVQSKDAQSRFRQQSATASHDAQTRFRLQQVGVRALDVLSRFRLQSGTVLRDALSRFRLVITPLRDALSRFRLQSPVILRDALARFRLLATKSVDIFSRFRLQSGTVSKDATARFRQQSGTTLHDVINRFRLVKAVGASGRFRLVKAVDALTRFRLQSVQQFKDTAARFRQQSALQSKDAPTRFRQQSATTYRDGQARFRLQQVGVRALDVLSRFRIQSGTLSRDTQTRFRLVITPLRDALTRFRVQSGVTTHDILARFRLQSPTQSKDAQSRFRQVATRSVDALSRFRVQSGQTLHDAQSRFRQQSPFISKDAQSRLRLQSGATNRDAPSRFRLQSINQRAMDALARFRLLTTKSVDALSRFRVQSPALLRDALARFRQQSGVTFHHMQSRFRQQSGTVPRDTQGRFRQQSALVARDTLSRFRLQIATLRALDAISRYRLLASKSMSAQTRFRLSLLLQGKDAAARFSLTAQTWHVVDSAPITITFRDAIAELAFRDGVGDLTFRDGFVEETFY